MKPIYLLLGLGLVTVLAASPVLAQRATDTRVNTDPAGTNASESHVLAASGSTLYVAWQDDRDNPGSSSGGIYFNRSLDGGATWLPADRRLDTGTPFGSADPQIAASGSSVYVIWSTDWDVYFNRSVDGGATWLASEVALNSGYDDYLSSARILASGSAVYVTWEGLVTLPGHTCDPFNPFCTDPDETHVWSVFFNGSPDGGTTWQGERTLNDVSYLPGAGGYPAYQAQMAVSGSSLYVTWAGQDYVSGGEHAGGTARCRRHIRDLVEQWCRSVDPLVASEKRHAHRPVLVLNEAGRWRFNSRRDPFRDHAGYNHTCTQWPCSPLRDRMSGLSESALLHHGPEGGHWS